MISSKTREIQNYAFEYNSLESEEVYLGEGMRVEEKNWFKLIKSTTFNDGFYPDSYGGFQIQMSLDTIQYNR